MPSAERSERPACGKREPAGGGDTAKTAKMEVQKKRDPTGKKIDFAANRTPHADRPNCFVRRDGNLAFYRRPPAVWRPGVLISRVFPRTNRSERRVPREIRPRSLARSVELR